MKNTFISPAIDACKVTFLALKRKNRNRKIIRIKVPRAIQKINLSLTLNIIAKRNSTNRNAKDAPSSTQALFRNTMVLELFFKFAFH